MAQASEKLEYTGPAKKERVASVPQREQLARTPELPCEKRKEQSCLFRVPDHKRGENVAPWRVRGRSEREHGEERVDATMMVGRFQEGEGR